VATIRGMKSGRIVAQRAWNVADARGEVAALLGQHRGRLEEVNVDSAGIGHYFAEHLEDLGYDVNPINVGEASMFPEQFANLKAELYWRLCETFETGGCMG
jgi:hypothetical protein